MSDTPMPPTTSQDALTHELHVHQIELKQQNEELQRTQFDRAAAHDRYRDLYDFAPVGYCTLDARGCIVKINLTGAGLLGQPRAALQGKPLARFVSQNDADHRHLYLRSEVERRIATDLRPPMLDDLGLGPATEWLARDTARRLNLKLTQNLVLNETLVDHAGRPS